MGRDFLSQNAIDSYQCVILFLGHPSLYDELQINSWQIFYILIEKDIEISTRRDRQTNRQTCRQTDRQTNKQKGRDRQINRLTDRPSI